MKNIVLDFGHGGIDANGKYTTAPAKMYKFPDGVVAYEGEINRHIGGLLEIFLKTQPNLNVVTTVKATDPRDLSLSYRVGVANGYAAKDTIFVSIHCNASGSHKASGFEVFTTKGTTKSDALATCIFDEVKTFYDTKGLRMRSDYTSDGDSDKEIDFYVLRKTKCPAVLLECLFFDNRPDYELLKNPEFIKKLAYQVYMGIMKYLAG